MDKFDEIAQRIHSTVLDRVDAIAAILREAFPQGEATKEYESVIAEIDKAQDEVKALCHGKRWIMCVPARPDEDSDLVISGALRAAKNAILSFRPARTDRCAKCGYTVYGCHCNPAEACAALHKHEEAEKALREAAQAVVDVYPYNVDDCQEGEHGPCRECKIIINLRALLANETEVKDA